jgi:hypothetical protein
MDTKFDNICEVAKVRKPLFGGLKKSTLDFSYQANRAITTGDLESTLCENPVPMRIISLKLGRFWNIASEWMIFQHSCGKSKENRGEGSFIVYPCGSSPIWIRSGLLETSRFSSTDGQDRSFSLPF